MLPEELIQQIEQEMIRAGLPLASPDDDGWPGDYEICFSVGDDGSLVAADQHNTWIIDGVQMLTALQQLPSKTPWPELDDHGEIHDRLDTLYELIESVEA